MNYFSFIDKKKPATKCQFLNDVMIVHIYFWLYKVLYSVLPVDHIIIRDIVTLSENLLMSHALILKFLKV